jgi:hypothetical protein
MAARPAWLASALLPLLGGWLPSPPGEEPRIDFARDIRPLLSDRCFRCHGPDEAARKGDLRLDLRAAATADLGPDTPIVPGHPERSLVIERIRHPRAKKRMPPQASGLELSEDEIARIERWIAEGADYAEHWAFVPPRRPTLPAVRDEGWPRDDLDRLVLARLEAEGLAPAPEADRATWLRRVTFDLTGLPPTLSELDAFLADAAPGAHERVVDRLLSSPQYGERMAADWLDAARYADSYGYQNDVARRVWPWRDWVVQAFNDDLPYDEFATWQLAGDLLPDATRDQRLATAFNRLHRMTNEGGSVEEEFRVEAVADRVNTFGTVFLGLTVECARCHDHKFDPISQREYYGLFAFFDDIDECGLYSHFTGAVPTPTLWLPDAEQERELALLEGEVAAREADLAAVQAGADGSLATWRMQRPSALPIQGRVAAYDFETPEGRVVKSVGPEGPDGALAEHVTLLDDRNGTVLAFDGDSAATFEGLGAYTRDDPFTIALRLWIGQPAERAVVLHRSKAWTDAGSRGYELLLEDGALSAALIHFWPGNALRVRAREPLPPETWLHVVMRYDGSSRAAGLDLWVDGVRVATDVIRDGLTRTIRGGGESALTLAERFRDRGLAGGRIDDLEVFDRALARPEIRELAHSRRGALAEEVTVDAAALANDPEGERELFLGSHHAPALEARAALHDARRARSQLVERIPEIMTMRAGGEPRTARVLGRGQYDAPGEPVEPGTPACVLPMDVGGVGDAGDAGARPDRLGLAQWLVDERNPLFARVAVNRLWQQLFGAGLVATPENLGNQGRVPELPELLDHLACELRASGWSQKALLRRIALSATYRQSSRASAEALARDPENRLYARGPRQPLSAEMLRDGALAASGLLVETIGGPPVKPYQPEGLWEEKSGTVYQPDTGEGLWRRSLYGFWKRTSPPPAMMLFDAAKRDVCAVRRQRTCTPLQALALWNDPQQVEAARKLAERVLRENGPEAEDATLVADLFRRCTAQEPGPGESAALTELAGEALATFRADPTAVEGLLHVGAAPVDSTLEASRVAALTVVAGTLFSYDGTVVLR